MIKNLKQDCTHLDYYISILWTKNHSESEINLHALLFIKPNSFRGTTHFFFQKYRKSIKKNPFK